MMRFALLAANWTDEAASIWGDTLELGRAATYDEAKAAFDKDGVGFRFADYFNEDGTPKGPCTMAVSVEGRGVVDWEQD